MKLRQIIPGGRKRPHSFLDKAEAAQRQGRWREAYEAFDSALNGNGSHFGILVQMGHMSKEMGEFERAKKHYFDAYSLQPDDWDLHVQIGHFYNRIGEAAQAKEWYEKANKIRPTSEISEQLRLLEGRHTVENLQKMRKAALEKMDARRFKAALPDVLSLYHDYGLRDFDVIAGHAFRELGRYQEALEMYSAYFVRCQASKSRHLKDAFLRLINILEIMEEHLEIIKKFNDFKQFCIDQGIDDVFSDDLRAIQKSHVQKLYGVFVA